MKINRNMSAVTANNQLLRTEGRLQLSMQKLSSGYKINSAEDNPAGMAISNKMRAQIDALDQAKSNASDAQNVMEIADGALNEISDILQRMRELSVQAANDTNTADDKRAIQDEIDELKKEVDRISGDTEYNTKTLLDGSSDTRVYTRELDTAGNASLSNNSITRINMSDKVEFDKYELTVNSLGESAKSTIANSTKPQAGTLSINGVTLKVTEEMSQDEYLQELQKTASMAGTEMKIEDTGEISFTSTLIGEKSVVEITLSNELSDLAGASYQEDEEGNFVAKDIGKNAEVKAGNNFTDTTISTDGNRVYVVGNNGFTMDFLLNSDIDMTAGAKNFQIDVTDIGNMTIQIGANQYQQMKVRIPEISVESMYLDTVDVTIAGGTDRALDTLDEAIAYTTQVRSRIGAFQNRLDYASNSLGETSEDMTGAYSNLMDTDMAAEMTEYSAQNILDQAGISVLSQANDLPQQVLSLLSK